MALSALPKKLHLKLDFNISVHNAPNSYKSLMIDLPDGAKLVIQPEKDTNVHIFLFVLE